MNAKAAAAHHAIPSGGEKRGRQPDAGAGRWPSQTVDCLIWAIGREPATDNFNLQPLA
jgi:pyruvate/2-oxoglutarate dehydrogenase complex dihydrolipoamide dehydrogenase (E3) component